MPIATCPRCHRRFIVENERSFQRTCPHCLRPMAMGLPEAPLAAAPPPPHAHGLPDDGSLRWLNDTPVAADEEGKRFMAVLAEAAYQRALAQARRRAPQAQQGDEANLTEQGPLSLPDLSPGDEEPLPEWGRCGGEVDPTPLRRSLELQQQSRGLIERVRAARESATHVQRRVRAARQARRRDPD